jgi:competence protein ComEA
VEQSPSWRVFDGPSPDPDGASARGGPPEGSQSAVGVQPIALLGIAAAVLVGSVAVAIALTASQDAVVDGPGASAVAFSSAAVDGTAAVLVVDVVGAVVRPGVYELPPGSRIGDAIDAAGGFSNRVDADRVAELNLAALLTDGSQVRVPSRDDPSPAAGGGGGGSAGSGGSGGSGATAPINLNTATQAELESLPGIGPVTAGKIIEARAQAAFHNIGELRERGLVGEKTFESIRALVTVG